MPPWQASAPSRPGIFQQSRSFFRASIRRSGWVSQVECEAYFHRMFFANPWADARLPSWVAMEGVRAVGFIGVMPRPMRLRGRPQQAAVVTQFMVEPEKRHGLTAAQLLRKALAGPQALTISDGANETSRKMWEALGGPHLHPLQPAVAPAAAPGAVHAQARDQPARPRRRAARHAGGRARGRLCCLSPRVAAPFPPDRVSAGRRGAARRPGARRAA